MTRECEQARPSRFRGSQESVTNITVNFALAGLILSAVADLREKECADRAAWQAESRQLRDEARADGKDFHRPMQALQSKVVRLTA